MSKSTLKILPALMVAITAALVTQPMRAGAIDTLVITENSSALLTAILTTSSGTTSLSVLNTSSDNWTIDVAGVSVTSIVDNLQFWAEPDAAGFGNQVAYFFVPNQLGVVSDIGLANALADGTADTTTFTLNGNPLSVTFFDKGDVATVPETGTTFSLFGLSLTGLGFLRRKLC
jgi:hypothetical protein